jgi:hypothetical protein
LAPWPLIDVDVRRHYVQAELKRREMRRINTRVKIARLALAYRAQNAQARSRRV